MKLNSLIREVISTLVTFAIVFAAVFIIQKFIVQPFVVEGHSMDYTLVEGERLFMWKLADIERFDVVVLKAPSNPEKLYIKRVIGVAGDTIEVKDDQLILNGVAMDEPYLAKKQEEFPNGFTNDFSLEAIIGQSTVPEGHVFVMGDNRQNSLDGRSFGVVPIESIVGEANVSYWPLDKIGLLQQYNLNDAGDTIMAN